MGGRRAPPVVNVSTMPTILASDNSEGGELIYLVPAVRVHVGRLPHATVDYLLQIARISDLHICDGRA